MYEKKLGKRKAGKREKKATVMMREGLKNEGKEIIEVQSRKWEKKARDDKAAEEECIGKKTGKRRAGKVKGKRQ